MVGTLMVLALPIDQVQVGFCRVVQLIMVKQKRFSYLIEKMRAIFDVTKIRSWVMFLSFLHTLGMIQADDSQPLWESRC